MDLPPDEISLEEAAHILATDPDAVHEVLRQQGWTSTQPLTRRGIEEIALTRWRRGHAGWPNSYWVTPDRAAAILAVNRSRVGQLVTAGLIPHERARTIRRQIVFRRDQLAVVPGPGFCVGNRSHSIQTGCEGQESSTGSTLHVDGCRPGSGRRWQTASS